MSISFSSHPNIMRAGFKKTARLFEVKSSGFEFIPEVKHKDKLYYKKTFKS